MIDYYEVLGVDRTADPRQIASAYRSLALKYHPDKQHPEASRVRFEQISEAFAILSDASARVAFDRVLATRTAHVQRTREMAGKRAQFVEELQRRESALDEQRRADLEAERVLAAEIERLRRREEATASRSTTKTESVSEFSLSIKSHSLFESDAQVLAEFPPDSAEILRVFINPRRRTQATVYFASREACMRARSNFVSERCVLLDADDADTSSAPATPTLSFEEYERQTLEKLRMVHQRFAQNKSA